MAGNPIALAEGAVGAPGVQGRALARDHATDAAKRLPPVTVSASNAVVIQQGLARVVLLATHVGAEADAVTYTNYSYNGVIRFHIDQTASPSQTWRIYVNGVVAASSTSTGATIDFDATVAVGDTIKMTLQTGGGTATFTFEERANMGYVVATPYILSTDI